MDENKLRQKIVRALEQLGARGLIVGDRGLLTVEQHRRRYLTQPAGRRRVNLSPADLICVDTLGQTVDGTGHVEEATWAPHRASYEKADTIKATLHADPPRLAALAKLIEPGKPLPLENLDDSMVVAASDQAGILDAIQAHRLVAVANGGVYVSDRSLDAVMNTIEAAEHGATVHLVEDAMRG